MKNLIFSLAACLTLFSHSACRTEGSKDISPSANAPTSTSIGTGTGTGVGGAAPGANDPVVKTEASSESTSTSTSTEKSSPDSKAAAAPGTKAACLNDNCTPPTSTVAPIMTFSSLSYFPEGQTNCELGEYVRLVKSLQINQMTIFYRAKYASLGRWQLYARQIQVGTDGTMSFPSEKVNLLPSCDGNVNGVTGFSLTEYADATGSTDRVLNISDVEKATNVKVSITCVNTAQSAVRVLNLATLSDSLETTVVPLSTLGARGYWPSKGVYLKSDGSSLNRDGTVGNLVVTVAPTSSMGSDDSGIYLRSTSGIRYITSRWREMQS
jgi:hypothetical protein